MVVAKYKTHKKLLMNMEEIRSAILNGASIEDDNGNILTKDNGELVNNIEDYLPTYVVRFNNNY